MRCRFVPAKDVATAAACVARYALSTDVYIGVQPRQRRASNRASVATRASVLWGDCDSAASIRDLARFTPRPTIVVASGSASNRHAYWLLREPVTIDIIENANQRLAGLLGADIACTDAPRMMRPPSSYNHKHITPTPVRLLVCNPSRRYRLRDIVGAVDVVPLAALAARRDVARSDRDDVLLNIDPALYVARLAGLKVPRSRTVRCPFHDDNTPSLHVYADAQRGWFCFGCSRGGSVYDFAAHLWGFDTRGSDFLELRDRLLDALGR
jgi:CHC2 zinc finger/RepB DNA-primase from phage plasmid